MRNVSASVPIVARPVHARRQLGTRSAGVSLIEVLVSVVIIAIGLLGIAAMQALVLRSGQSSYESSQASIQSQSILESIRANRANLLAYNTVGLQCDAGAGGGTLAENDLRDWISAVKLSIGRPDDASTCGGVECSIAGDCRVTVQWNDDRAGGGETRQLTVETKV